MEIGGDVDVVAGRNGTKLQTIVVPLHDPEQGPLAGIAVSLQRRRQLKRAVADFGQKCSGGRDHLTARLTWWVSTAPTPLVRVELEPGIGIWCKLEFLNPSGSTKDRVARYILGDAQQTGLLHAGDLVIEASSGSTSIAMALVCAQMGFRFMAVMPEGVSDERTLMIRAYGGQIRMTPREGGIAGAIAESERLGGELGAFLPRQFSNILNVEAHRYGTAPEILAEVPKVSAAVSGVGTGGTLVGLALGCKGAIPVYARPIDHLSSDPECCGFSARIPGVAECVSRLFREDLLPELETIEVRAEDAIAVTRRIIASGYPVGPSSGLNYCAAIAIARRLGPEANVVTVFPDRMERYFSTELFRGL